MSWFTGCIRAGITEFLLSQPSHVSLGWELVCRGHAASSALVTSGHPLLCQHRGTQAEPVFGLKALRRSGHKCCPCCCCWECLRQVLLCNLYSCRWCCWGNGMQWGLLMRTSVQHQPGASPGANRSWCVSWHRQNYKLSQPVKSEYGNRVPGKVFLTRWKTAVKFSTLIGKSLLTHVGVNSSDNLFMACACVSVTSLYKKSWFLKLSVLGLKTTARNYIKEESMTCTLTYTHLCFCFQNRQKKG